MFRSFPEAIFTANHTTDTDNSKQRRKKSITLQLLIKP